MLPTVAGAELVDELIQYRNEVVTAILSRLDPDQLRTVETAFHYMLESVASIERERESAGAVA